MPKLLFKILAGDRHMDYMISFWLLRMLRLTTECMGMYKKLYFWMKWYMFWNVLFAPTLLGESDVKEMSEEKWNCLIQDTALVVPIILVAFM